MNIKAYLRDYPFINTELQMLQKELNALIHGKHDTYCTLKAVPLTGMPSGHNVSDSVYDTVQLLVDRYDHKIRYYTSQINNLLDEKALFDNVWFNNIVMTNEARTIIQLRCFEHRSWREIARISNYSDKQCQRILENATQKMQCEVDVLSDDIREHAY